MSPSTIPCRLSPLLLGAAATLMLAAGCSTVSVVPQRADALKTVAVIGFTGEVNLAVANEPSTSVGATINAVKSVSHLASGEMDARYREEAEHAYEGLLPRLASLGWKPLAREALVGNSEYAARVQSTSRAGSTMAALRLVPGVLAESAARRLGPEDRAALCRALGVDAVAIVDVRYVVGKTSGMAIGGVGKVVKYPKAVTSIAVYEGGSADPLWKDYGAEGSAATTGVENVMGATVLAQEAQALQQATDSSYEELLRRFAQARTKG